MSTITATPTIIVFVAAFLVAACGRESVVTGFVRDNFGAPVEGARVAVDDGAVETVTDGTGAFSFGHAPGRVPFLVTADGFATAEYSLAIADEEEPPLEVVVQRLPPGEGLWVVGDGTYSPVAGCRVTSQRGDQDEVRYLVERGIPSEIVPDAAGRVTFVDSGTPVGESGPMIARVDDDYLFYRTERTIATTDTIYTDRVETSAIVPDYPHEGAWFSAELSAGTYLYVDRGLAGIYANVVPNLDGRCFLFRVGPVVAPWLSDEITEEQLGAFTDQVKACWPEPPDGPAREQVVTVQVGLNTDGTISTPPTGVWNPFDTIRSGAAFVSAQAAALAAVASCQPYRMFPADHHDAWRDLTVTLRTAEMFGPGP